MRLAGIHASAGRYDRAVAVLREALAIDPSQTVLQRDIAIFLLQGGQPEKAIEAARAVQRDRPTEAVGWIIEGDVLAERRRWADALRAYREAEGRSGAQSVAERIRVLREREDAPPTSRCLTHPPAAAPAAPPPRTRARSRSRAPPPAARPPAAAPDRSARGR